MLEVVFNRNLESLIPNPNTFARNRKELISDVVGEQDTEKKNQGKVTLQSANFSSLLNLVLGGLLWSAARTSTKLLVTRKHDS